jgi:hypothetical protein
MTQSPDTKPETARAVEPRADAGGALAEEPFEMSEDVQTEYERGIEDGKTRMRSLADDVLARARADELEIEALKARVDDLNRRLRTPALPAAGEVLSKVLSRWQEKLADLEDMKRRGDLTKDWGECSLINARTIVQDLTAALALLQSKEAGRCRNWAGDCAAFTDHGIVCDSCSSFQASPVPQGQEPRTITLTPPTPDQVEYLRGLAAENPGAKIFEHKWLNPNCIENGCQSPAPTGVAPVASGGSPVADELGQTAGDVYGVSTVRPTGALRKGLTEIAEACEKAAHPFAPVCLSEIHLDSLQQIAAKARATLAASDRE